MDPVGGRVVTDPATSRRMSAQRTTSTAPELAVRHALFARGQRYRVQYRLPALGRRRIDIAFPRRRVAIFIDGCYWHGCPTHATWPKTNAEWWRAKIERNRARDGSTDEHLLSLGWTVVRIWEHEIDHDLDGVVQRICEAITKP